MTTAKDETIKAFTEEMIDRGKLIEAGFVSLRMNCMAKDAPPDQVSEMRMAFFAGAQHLFASILSTLDEDREPTEADQRRLEQIDAELREFGETLKARLGMRT